MSAEVMPLFNFSRLADCDAEVCGKSRALVRTAGECVLGVVTALAAFVVLMWGLSAQVDRGIQDYVTALIMLGLLTSLYGLYEALRLVALVGLARLPVQELRARAKTAVACLHDLDSATADAVPSDGKGKTASCFDAVPGNYWALLALGGSIVAGAFAGAPVS